MFTHFQHVLSTSSQVSFFTRVPCFLVTCWGPCGTIFQKIMIPRIAPTKVPRQIQTPPYSNARRLPERPPRVCTSQTRNISSSPKRCSNLLPMPLFQQQIARKCCLEWLQLQMLRKHISKMKRIDVNSTLLMIWHALGTDPTTWAWPVPLGEANAFSASFQSFELLTETWKNVLNADLYVCLSLPAIFPVRVVGFCVFLNYTFYCKRFAQSAGPWFKIGEVQPKRDSCHCRNFIDFSFIALCFCGKSVILVW